MPSIVAARTVSLARSIVPASRRSIDHEIPVSVAVSSAGPTSPERRSGRWPRIRHLLSIAIAGYVVFGVTVSAITGPQSVKLGALVPVVITAMAIELIRRSLVRRLGWVLPRYFGLLFVVACWS
jgi:hypothetical protein